MGRKTLSKEDSVLSNYHKDLFEIHLKQSDETHLVYKQNLKAKSSLNKMSS